jgi:hypothetical protein
MDISPAQNYCIYCKRKLTEGKKSFHLSCYDEILLFNQNTRIELDVNINQIYLLALLLSNTRLQLQEALKLRKNDINLEKSEVYSSNKVFKLSVSKCTEIGSILENFSFSENLFATQITYPSQYSLSSLKSVRLLNLV